MPRSQIIHRLVIDIIILVLLMEGLWFLALPLVFIGPWFFPYYFEALFAGAMYDSLFGMSGGLGVFAFSGILLSIVSASFVQIIKGAFRK